jgi:hypothetical protein
LEQLLLLISWRVYAVLYCNVLCVERERERERDADDDNKEGAAEVRLNREATKYVAHSSPSLIFEFLDSKQNGKKSVPTKFWSASRWA